MSGVAALRLVPARTYEQMVEVLERVYGKRLPAGLSADREAVRELAAFHARVDRLMGKGWERAQERAAEILRSPLPNAAHVVLPAARDGAE